MPRRNCAAGTAGRPSRLKTRRAFFSAPQRGVFAPLGRGGERLRPTFLFLSREKKKRAAPGTKKKSAGSGFRDESCSFFLCALRPENGCLGAMRTGFTFCAADADGCGQASLRAGTNGFRCESRFFFLCVYVLMAAPWCWADWFYRLRR